MTRPDDSSNGPGPGRAANGRFGPTDLFMILTTLVWGINLSLIKISLRELRPHAFNGVRLTVSAVLYGFVLLASRRKAPALGRDAWKIIGLAVLGVMFY